MECVWDVRPFAVTIISFVGVVVGAMVVVPVEDEGEERAARIARIVLEQMRGLSA